MIEARIDAVLIGKAVTFGPKGQPSAMHKVPQSERLAVTPLGIAGDEQADLINHGGLDKAIHHYPFDHYATWTTEQPELAVQLSTALGQFGENISTQGLVEGDICIGDTFRFGTALIQVSQGRQPCWKLNTRFGWKKMAAAVQSTGRTGWYYRVLETGKVKAGDKISLIERPHPAFALTRLQHALYVKMLDFEELKQIADLSALAEGWRNLAKRRLATEQVESWGARLGE